MAYSSRSSVVLENYDCLVDWMTSEMRAITINSSTSPDFGGIHMPALGIDRRSVVDKVEMYCVLTDDLCIES